MPISRRSFIAAARRSFIAAASASVASAFTGIGWAAGKIPVGIELYSVRGALEKDLMGTVRAVAKMGYEVVEFYSPYFAWTPAYAKQVRALLDELHIRCLSTHNDSESFTPDGLKKAVELNQIIGSKCLIWASAGDATSIDGWKGIAARLVEIQAALAPNQLSTGYHNHGLEFRPLNGSKPMDVLAANTPKDVVMQLDVGHCVEAGGDPVAFIKAHPGRVRSLHCKDYSSAKGSRLEHTETPTSAGTSFGNGGKVETGFRVLIGEGDVRWPRVVEAAESVGGVEYYLIEQEGSRFPELETAERSLANWKRVRSGI